MDVKEYLTCKYATAYGVSLQKARRFTKEEKAGFADWYKEKGFVATSEQIKLEYIVWLDVREILKNRSEDGSFQGCGNSAYIISEDEWNELATLNNKKKLEKELASKLEEIKECEKTIEACEKQSELYTREEARKKAREYNILYNEGGYGYVPHFYTTEEYEFAKKRLSELTKS